MAGARQFDTEAAEAGITRAFWRHGYSETSIERIEAETGLKRGSLYNAFGGKEAMFAIALRRYAGMAAGHVFAALEAETPEQGVATLFAGQIAALDDPALPHGCLVTDALSACEALPADAANAVAAVAARQHAMLATALRRWQAAGLLDPAADMEGLARLLAATMYGIAAQFRSAGDRKAAEAAAAAAVRALDAFQRR
ncbi:TetR/AcrR family transcriptional regulator [Elioraea rosea]|uniref:TetR/AcrR family transcriptional regulator n=1 Tax=Elioraea rosea TaxID=2492390 RepID=UPI0013151E12|nr:TetR/AcrR family transcriptional regulator [Elioraea rosea]